MKHIWQDTEFGIACWRCGYFTHTDEAKEACSGRYDDAKLKLLDEERDRVEKVRQVLSDAQRAAPPAPEAPTP